jgi:hypothetical protein
LLLERILENDDKTSRSTHGDREASLEVLRLLLFPRTSLEKIRNEELNITSFTTKTPNHSLNP